MRNASFFAVHVGQGKNSFFRFKGYEMLTYVIKYGINRVILTQIARLLINHNLANPPRLQKNIGKEVFKEARK